MAKAAQPAALKIGRHQVPIEVRRSARARHISLHVDTSTGTVQLVLPRGTSHAEGLEFAREKSVWIRNHLAVVPPRVPFADGTIIPVLGVEHRIRHRPGGRGGVWVEGRDIHVAGREEHLPRRLTDWLKQVARQEIAGRARDKAQIVGRRVARVTIRETRSRWGSCSEAGNLNFSWRLIFAPEPVLDYVVAHEVAHLIELNHSRRFWRITERLTDNVDGPRSWLRRHGAKLHRYG